LRIVLALVAILGTAIGGEARADDLQNQVLAAARATPREGFSFKRTIVSEQSGSPRRTFVEQFDPRKPPAQRWTLVSVDGRAPTPQELDQSRKAQRGPTPSYADVADWFGAPATRSDGAAGTVVYRFASLPKGAFKIGSHDASANMRVEAVVNTRGKIPFLERVRIVSAGKMRIMLVALIESMVINGLYRQLPDGHAVPAESNSETSGSMFGKSGLIRASVSYADFQPVN
jgi:hypothetical protein